MKYDCTPESPFDYDSIPVGYYDLVFQRRCGVQSKWHHLKFQHVSREFSPGALHLDIGCGPGTFISTLPGSIESRGVDVAAGQVEYARRHHGERAKQFEVTEPGKLSFSPNSFDIVTLLELIEHISVSEAELLLAEVFRVLRPRGKLVVTTPNYASLWPLLEYLVDRLGGVAYADQHITKYVASQLKSLLARAGFEDVQVKTCLFSAPFLAALSWGLADRMDRWESALVSKGIGHLLIATAYKR